MSTVTIVALDTKHGLDIGVYADEGTAWSDLASYCYGWWEDDGPGGRVPTDDKALVDAYFEHQADQPNPESFVMETKQVRGA